MLRFFVNVTEDDKQPFSERRKILSFPDCMHFWYPSLRFGFQRRWRTGQMVGKMMWFLNFLAFNFERPLETDFGIAVAVSGNSLTVGKHSFYKQS